MRPRLNWLCVVVVCLFLLPAVRAQAPASENQSAASPAQAASAAEVPRLIKFSGTLLDAQDRPMAGPVGVTFALHAQQTGGAALWMETQNVEPDARGNYTILLGANSAKGVPAELFVSGEARWLEVQVERQAAHERILLVSVPYALKAGDAQTLGGKPASAYLTTETLTSAGTSAAATTTAASSTRGTLPKSSAATKAASAPQPAVACTSVASDGTATVNSIALFKTACSVQSSVIAQSGSNVGIGTAAPAVAMDIVGNNAGLRLSGTGTHQVTVTGASSGRLGEDVQGFFFASDTNGKVIKFLTNNGALNEWMRITSAGNVGIGTPTPAAKLDINGNLNLPATTSATVGVISLGGTPFAHNFGSFNTFLGANAGNFTMSGNTNTASGVSALQNNTTGSDNAAFGALALQSNTTGNANTASGVSALQNNTGGNDNAAFGASALNRNTTGNSNSAFGAFALPKNTTGSQNSAFGLNALVSNTAGGSNSAFGDGALASNTTGGGNNAFGSNALATNGTGSSNAAFGTAALAGGGTGNSNAAFGNGALNVTVGNSNTAIGQLAGASNATGSNNTFVGSGADAGATGLNNATAIGSGAIVSASNALVLGSGVNVGIGTGSPAQTLTVNGTVGVWNRATANFYRDSGATLQGFIGASPIGDMSLISKRSGDFLRLGANNSDIVFWTDGNADVNNTPQMDLSTTALLAFGTCLAGTCLSDVRLKKNIEPFSPALAKLMRLQPVHFNWRVAEYPEYHFGSSRNFGLIAQEVEKVFPEMVSVDEGGFKRVNYGELPYLMLQAIRELSAQKDKLQEEMKAKEAQWEERFRAQERRVSLRKDAQIRKLTQQVQELQKVHQDIAALEARLSRAEIRGGSNQASATTQGVPPRNPGGSR